MLTYDPLPHNPLEAPVSMWPWQACVDVPVRVAANQVAAAPAPPPCIYLVTAPRQVPLG